MNNAQEIAIVEHLSKMVTDERLRKMNEVLDLRTKHVTVLLENIFQPHNASAVLRSCDCFGVQDIHIIENINKYQINPDVALGSGKWVSLHRYRQYDNPIQSSVALLKEKGYRIVATTPDPNGCPINELPLDKPIALLFGTEKDGLSDEALAVADMNTWIPMVGFTESFNISVSAALCIYELTSRLRNSEIDWRLTEEQRNSIFFQWLKNHVRNSEMIIQDFLKKMENHAGS